MWVKRVWVWVLVFGCPMCWLGVQKQSVYLAAHVTCSHCLSFRFLLSSTFTNNAYDVHHLLLHSLSPGHFKHVLFFFFFFFLFFFISPSFPSKIIFLTNYQFQISLILHNREREREREKELQLKKGNIGREQGVPSTLHPLRSIGNFTHSSLSFILFIIIACGIRKNIKQYYNQRER